MSEGAIPSGGDFGGFDAADFDAFVQKKWGSNAYTLERRRVKDRLLALARAAEKELSEDLVGLEMGATDEAPSVANGRKVQSLSVFFLRTPAERTALKALLGKTNLGSAGLFDIALHHQHACLLLRIDAEGLSLGVHLATKAKVDRDNAAEKLKQKWGRDRLAELCRALPFGAVVGVQGSTVDALTLTPEQLETFADPLTKSDEPFVVETRIPRSEEVLGGESLIGTVIEQLGALLPVQRFLAWSRENDLTQVKDAIQVEKKKQQERLTFEAGARVTILSGLFAGRGGYVSEVSKGKVKVMVGPVAVTVDVKDLKPC